MMTHDDEVCLKLGREIVRMIRELMTATEGETGYTRRKFTFPGGAVHLFVATDVELADLFERIASGQYTMQDMSPPTTKN